MSSKQMSSKQMSGKPTIAFVVISWAVLGAGIISYLVGLWNSDMELNEKGYYFVVLTYGLFSAVSVQKCVRDRLEGIPVTDIYYGLSWLSATLAVVLLGVGLYNIEGLELSEKGFFGIAFLMSLFAAIAVQKNTRDTQEIQEVDASE